MMECRLAEREKLARARCLKVWKRRSHDALCVWEVDHCWMERGHKGGYQNRQGKIWASQ